jgi:hypothetical protein
LFPEKGGDNKLEWNVNENTIEVEFEWHRGVIPVPVGTITIGWYYLGKKLNFRKSVSTDLAWEIWDRTLNEIMGLHNGLKFGGSYTEFLYPNSPSLGLNIHMPWSSEYRYSIDDIILDYRQYYPRNVLIIAERKYKRIAETYDNALAEIKKFVEDKIPEIMEEQELSEKEMEEEMELC